MRFLGFLAALTLLATAQSAAATVLYRGDGTSQTDLAAWGASLDMPVLAQPHTSGPIILGQNVTFNSNSHTSLIGYNGAMDFGPGGQWAAGGSPMAALADATGSMTFDFVNPVSVIMAQLNWVKPLDGGAPVVMSIYDAAGHLLESVVLSDQTGDLEHGGYYGFLRSRAEISRLVLSNGYIAARDFYLGESPGSLRFGFAGPVENAPVPDLGPTAAVPEPATWSMMLMGFGLAGAHLRRRRPALARVAAR